MKNYIAGFCMTLMIFGVPGGSLGAQVLLENDFANGDFQGWAEYSTSTVLFAAFGTEQISTDPDNHVLRMDNTVAQTGSGQSYALNTFENQTDGILRFSLSIRFLDEGGVGTQYQGGARLSIQGANTGTYVRLDVGSNVSYYRDSSDTTRYYGTVKIEYDVWYDVVQTIDLTNPDQSTYFFSIQSRANPADFYESSVVNTYYKQTTGVNRVIVRQQTTARSGLYEIDHVRVEIIPEPGVAALGLVALGVAGGAIFHRRRKNLLFPQAGE